MKSRLSAALMLMAMAAHRGDAQCADGSAPPCRVARVAVADRPLDDRNWLVLPFDNVARDPSLDVFREASVTLLYSAMSEWSDIRVVDDMRVADLMRGIPANTRLGQDAAFDMARRVGAGKVVMGTLIKEGQRTRIQAAVFDVRRAQRLRSPSVLTVGTDSLSTVFAGLAQQVLAVAAPLGVALNEVGTQSTEALRAYAAGLEAERRMASDSAVLHYRRAVVLDSTFALAHYHLAVTLNDVPEVAPATIQAALDAAQRHARRLPRRERGQIAVRRAPDARAGCAIVDQMLGADSTDAWAWWWHGNCRLLSVPNDSNRLRARLAVDNARIADWRRAIALDTTFYAPVQAVVSLLNNRFECRAPVAPCPEQDWYEPYAVVSGDTLIYRLHRPYVESRAYHATAEAVDARRRRTEMARSLLSAFLVSNPNHPGAHFALADRLVRLGDLDAAERELGAALGMTRLREGKRVYYVARFNLELIRKRPSFASAFADSVYEDPTARVSPQPASIVGRYSMEAEAVHRGNDSLIAMRKAWLPVFAGALPPDWDRLVDRFARAYGTTAAPNSRAYSEEAARSLSYLVAFKMRKYRPASDTAHPDPIYRFQAWFTLGDTTRARLALAESDKELDARPREARDDGAWAFNGESHVLLADSAAALSRLRDFVERWPRVFDTSVPVLMSERGFPMNNFQRGMGRVWLLYADLAAAAGSKDEARQAYQFVVDLWKNGDAPVQPFVARARAALNTLR